MPPFCAISPQGHQLKLPALTAAAMVSNDYLECGSDVAQRSCSTCADEANTPSARFIGELRAFLSSLVVDDCPELQVPVQPTDCRACWNRVRWLADDLDGSDPRLLLALITGDLAEGFDPPGTEAEVYDRAVAEVPVAWAAVLDGLPKPPPGKLTRALCTYMERTLINSDTFRRLRTVRGEDQLMLRLLVAPAMVKHS